MSELNSLLYFIMLVAALAGALLPLLLLMAVSLFVAVPIWIWLVSMLAGMAAARSFTRQGSDDRRQTVQDRFLCRHGPHGRAGGLRLPDRRDLEGDAVSRAPDPACRDALKWLAERGGDGVFADKSHQVLYAMGEKAPFMRSTWNRLSELGRVEFYGKRRCRILPTTAAEGLPA